MNIAMWSGPRNLSTAMMYAFGARPDCAVRDEPFYAAYLDRTGLDHPMREEILAAQPRDPEAVAKACAAPDPGGRPHLYLKLMTHHMLPEFDTGWMAGLTHVFLIRHPARVIASYDAKRGNPTAEDIGTARQEELFETAKTLTGRAPKVIDSADIRADPETMLRKLCAAIGLPFDEAMLHWPEGGHPDDGVWAPHWYGAVHRSTGFAPPEGPPPALPGHLRPVLEAAMPHYLRLKERAL